MTTGTALITARNANTAFSLNPLMFETFVCSMAMMAFAALAGPIARLTGMAAWQIGAQGLGVVIGPLIGTAAYAIDPRAPFGLIAAGLTCVALGNLRRSPLMTSFSA